MRWAPDPRRGRDGLGPLAARVQTVTTGVVGPTYTRLFTLVFLAIGLMPFAMGLRLDLARRESAIIAGAVTLACIAAPSDAWATNLISERLTLFLFPAYALMFIDPPAPSAERPRLRTAATFAMLTATVGVMVMHLVEAVGFGREQAGFERVIARLDPGQRAMALIFDRHTKASVVREAYLHYALWYQAEKGGFVEFNFAWFHPEVVRYRQITPAIIPPDDGWQPEAFDWAAHPAGRYRYLLVRGPPHAEAAVLARAPCRPGLVAADGEWSAYDTKVCAPLALR